MFFLPMHLTSYLVIIDMFRWWQRYQCRIPNTATLAVIDIECYRDRTAKDLMEGRC